MTDVVETSLMDKAKRYSKEHIKAVGVMGKEWSHGTIHNVWVDDDKVVCVQYADGCWWHYKEDESGEIKWW